MPTKTKIRTAAAALAISLTALAGVAGTASASSGTPTKVTIQAESDGFFGYVKSSDQNCELNRKVTLFEMLGSTPDPHNDQKIGSDLAQPNGPDSMWSTGNSGSTKGSHYAKVSKSPGCKGAISKVITL